MMGLAQIRSINAWSKSQEQKRLARRLNKGRHEGRVKDKAGVDAATKGTTNETEAR